MPPALSESIDLAHPIALHQPGRRCLTRRACRGSYAVQAGAPALDGGRRSSPAGTTPTPSDTVRTQERDVEPHRAPASLTDRCRRTRLAAGDATASQVGHNAAARPTPRACEDATGRSLTAPPSSLVSRREVVASSSLFGERGARGCERSSPARRLGHTHTLVRVR